MLKDIYLAGGCFWGAEHYLKRIRGVVFTETGYANGHTEKPTYEEVYTDLTGYAETVHVRYDTSIVGLRFLLRMYFMAIDPTSINKQGPDVGTRYRTGIYYTDKADLAIINEVMLDEIGKHEGPICVEVLPLSNFHRAEEYHQGYLDKNPDGYCHLPFDLFFAAEEAEPEID